MTKAQQLIEKYKACWSKLSEYEKAVAEKQIWDNTEPGERGGPRRDYLAKHIGRTHAEVQVREGLLRLGDAAAPLWKLIDSGDMVPRTAYRIGMQARKRFLRTGSPLKDAVEFEIGIHNAIPVRIRADGTKIRSRNPSFVRTSNTHEPEKKKRRKPKQDDGSKALFSKIREIIGQYLDERLKDMDPIVKEQLSIDFSKILNAALHEFRGRVYRAQRDGKEIKRLSQEVGRREILEACRALRMPAPKPGQPINMLVAKRQKRALARVFHPDLNNGNHSMTSQYDEVVKAFDLVEEYNRRLSGDTQKVATN